MRILLTALLALAGFSTAQARPYEQAQKASERQIWEKPSRIEPVKGYGITQRALSDMRGIYLENENVEFPAKSGRDARRIAVARMWKACTALGGELIKNISTPIDQRDDMVEPGDTHVFVEAWAQGDCWIFADKK